MMTRSNTSSCGSCVHSDFEGSGWVRWCAKKRDYIRITGSNAKRCQHYEDAFAKDLFGMTTYAKMVEAGMITDATSFTDSRDLRTEMTRHRSPNQKTINRLNNRQRYGHT